MGKNNNRLVYSRLMNIAVLYLLTPVLYFLRIEQLRVTSFALSRSTSGWQNYGVFIWQWEEICFGFANQPCFGY